MIEIKTSGEGHSMLGTNKVVCNGFGSGLQPVKNKPKITTIIAFILLPLIKICWYTEVDSNHPLLYYE